MLQGFWLPDFRERLPLNLPDQPVDPLDHLPVLFFHTLPVFSRKCYYYFSIKEGGLPMTNLIKERNEVRRVLRRLSPRGVERLRTYALHVEMEERQDLEPPLTPEEEECLAISRAEFAEGKEIPLKDVMDELW